jgi:hypothetical protein
MEKGARTAAMAVPDLSDGRRSGPQASQLRSQSLYCQACATRWVLRRQKARDYRLEVVAGPAELLGLDMALTNWYDEMKRDFQPSPVPVSGVDLLLPTYTDFAPRSSTQMPDLAPRSPPIGLQRILRCSYVVLCI